jgi:divalent metal cation (Fe/Co/Zn/Cd) transporter
VRPRLLNRLTIGWNLAEGVIAVVAGALAGSVSLIGFGLDSGIEVSAAAILAWRLAKESWLGCMADFDHRATRLIAASFAVLAAYVGAESIRDLIVVRPPHPSLGGIVLAAVSLVVIPLLARAKRRLAPVLGSQAAASEANQTSLCALLAAVLLIGLGLNAALGWC